MISPMEIHRASRRWKCGWFVAWTRLRCRREYWSSHTFPSDTSRLAQGSAFAGPEGSERGRLSQKNR
jgi:hypothetical protein